MNILALDTATEACSVALMRTDGAVFAEFELAPRQHNRLLMEMLDRVLCAAAIDRSAIDFCAYTNGPGAFTGIRIGTAQAQGIGLGLDIPLIPLSTLAVMAQQCFQQQPYEWVIATLDARMGEIYWGQYQRDSEGLARLAGAEHLSSIGTPIPVDPVDAIIGSGASVIDQSRLTLDDSRLLVDCLPDARAMLPLACRAIADNSVVPASAAPINYLRNQVAEKSRPR